MKTRIALISLLLISLISTSSWLTLGDAETLNAQAQTAQDPRMVKPGETDYAAVNRVIQTIYTGAAGSTTVRSSADYALPMGNINNNSAKFTKPSQMDMNADGLIDLIYSGTVLPEYNLTQDSTAAGYIQYVMLNTGNGFRLVYACKQGPPTYHYQGDCAQ